MTASGKRNILLGTLVLAVVSIPLKNNWNSWALVLFCIAAITQQPLKEGIANLKKDPYWILSTMFFIWMAATWFWDSSGGFTFKYLEPNASFIFLPLVMSYMKKLTSRQLMIACYAFIASVVTVCIICLAKSYLEYGQTHDYRVFFYHYLGFQMGLNAVYLSNYCIASIIWLVYFSFFYKGEQFVMVSTSVRMLVAVFLFLMMFLLSSKMSLALIVLYIFSLAVYIAFRKKAILVPLLILTIIGATAFILAKNLPYLSWRIASTEWKAYAGAQDDNNGLALRLTTWQSALELIKEKPVLGYGLKGANEALVEKYREKKFERGIPERYNSHNQFLETTLKSGIIGFLLLLSLIAIPFIISVKKGKYLLCMMVVHFALVSMVEGTMEVQQELTFYWFFIFLFHYHYFPAGKKIQ